MQIVLREKFVRKCSKNFVVIEELCNKQYAEGYKPHTFAQSTATSYQKVLVVATEQYAILYLKELTPKTIWEFNGILFPFNSHIYTITTTLTLYPPH